MEHLSLGQFMSTTTIFPSTILSLGIKCVNLTIITIVGSNAYLNKKNIYS